MFIICFLKKVCNLPVLKPSSHISTCCSHVSDMDSSKMHYLIAAVSTWAPPSDKYSTGSVSEGSLLCNETSKSDILGFKLGCFSLSP